MGKGESNVVPKQSRFLCRERWILEELRQPRNVRVGEKLGGFRGEEACRGQDIEPFLPSEAKDGANAVEHLATYTAVTRFKPAQRAVIDLGEAGHFFLGEFTLTAQPHEELAQRGTGSRRCLRIRGIHGLWPELAGDRLRNVAKNRALGRGSSACAAGSSLVSRGGLEPPTN